MKTINLPDDLESPNDTFFTRQIVDHCLANAQTQNTIDYDKLNGKTLKIKLPSLMTQLQILTCTMISKGAKGYFWVVCSPAVCTMLEEGRFVQSHFEQIPLGCNVVMFMGILDKKWRIYTDTAVPVNTLLIGAGFSKKSFNYYCKLQIENFCK